MEEVSLCYAHIYADLVTVPLSSCACSYFWWSKNPVNVKNSRLLAKQCQDERRLLLFVTEAKISSSGNPTSDIVTWRKRSEHPAEKNSSATNNNTEFLVQFLASFSYFEIKWGLRSCLVLSLCILLCPSVCGSVYVCPSVCVSPRFLRFMK